MKPSLARSLLLAVPLALAGCATLDDAAQTVKTSQLNPVNWTLTPEPPPGAPAVRDVAAVDGIPSVRETPGARLWLIEPGTTARAMMAKWSAEEGYKLFWQASVDRPIKAGASVYDTFENATLRVFTEGFIGPPHLLPIFKHANRVVLITQDGTLGQ